MEEEYEGETIRFFPDHVLTEAIVAYIALGIIISLAVLFPAPLKEPANPFETPAHIKPEWYYLAMYQALKYFPSKIFGMSGETVGVILMGGAFLAFFLVPFVDRGESRHPKDRKLLVGFGTLVIILMLLLTYIGFVS
ncbi:MAG: hypothetical protein ACE5K0_08205 [Candidatus Methanofastidiosia archaeon]